MTFYFLRLRLECLACNSINLGNTRPPGQSRARAGPEPSRSCAGAGPETKKNYNVTVHDAPEPELFVKERDPVFPIAAAADRALRTGDGEVPEYAIRDVPFIPEGIPAPSTFSGFKSRSVYITIERIIKFKRLLDARPAPAMLVLGITLTSAAKGLQS